jgi:hypothetical protein
MKHAKILDFVFMKFAELLSNRRIKICLTVTSVTLSAKVNRISGIKKLEGRMPLRDHLMRFEKIKSKKF